MKVRDPKLRKDVLCAYNYQCVVCGFDLALDRVPIGIEAAHIKWKQYSDPCEVSNGLALCSIHHKAFDRGAITLDSDFKVRVSPAVTGGQLVDRLIWDFESKQIQLPRERANYPAYEMLKWHFREVFKFS